MYMSVFVGGGGGATGELTEVLAVSADFSEYVVPEGGVCYTFSESPKKGLFGDVWVGGGGGVGDHMFEKIARDCSHLGSKRPVSWSGQVWL